MTIPSTLCTASDASRVPIDISLRGVVGIDSDIFLGEIAGPKAADAGTDTEVDADVVFGLRKVEVGGLLIEQRRASAAAADLMITKPDIDLAGIDGDAGVADRGEDTTPVRIVARPGRLD